jgi:hypothetical protein
MDLARQPEDMTLTTLSPKLAQDAAIVGLDPFLGKTTRLVVAKDIRQFEHDALPGGGNAPTGEMDVYAPPWLAVRSG